MEKNITNVAEITTLNFDKPRLGYFQTCDAFYGDDVRIGIFIGHTVIDVTNGEQLSLDALRAVKFSDYWFDFFTEDLMDSMGIEVGFPFDWEEIFEDDEEDE